MALQRFPSQLMLALLVTGTAVSLPVACSGEDKLPGTTLGGTGGAGVGCQDEDGDGFGVGCISGSDCDDSDATVTDACYRCQTPNEGCPCNTNGTKVECGKVASQTADSVTCVTGERECINGEWGECSIDSMQTQTIKRSKYARQSVATDPTPCDNNPCDPFCKNFDKDAGVPDLGDSGIYEDGGITLMRPTPPDAGTPVGTSNCASTPHVAERDPLGMVLMVDRSGSMGSYFNNVRTALTSFVQSPGVDGMTAALDFFPSNSNQCSGGQYTGSGLSVGMGLLPGNQAALLGAINPGPGTGGATPMNPALNGALLTATQWVNAAPSADRKGVVVLVTDGLPTDCTNCGGKKGKSAKNEAACRVQEVANLAENYFFAGTSIETFVVGVNTGSNLDYLDVIARAGSGGARDAFIISGGSASSALVTVLNEIRDQALSCEFEVPAAPAGEVIDPTSAEVTLNAGGSTTNLTRVDAPGDCTGNEFYYDAATDQILLCPSACTVAKSDLTADIDITYDCLAGCVGGSSRGEPGPLSMFVMMDRSGSMNSEVDGVSLWYAATLAMRNFVRSPESEGMGFGINYFPPANGCHTCGVCTGFWSCDWQKTPYPTCDDPRSSGGYGDCNGGAVDGRPLGNTTTNPSANGAWEYYRSNRSTCSSNDFRNFSFTGGVPIAPLDGGSGTHTTRVYQAMGRIIPNGGTPTRPALQGAIDEALAYKASHPDEKVVTVLVTDGQPTSCSSTIGNVTTVAQNGRNNGIETYVVGVGSGATGFNPVSQAGSGTNAFLVDTGNPSEFITAMQEIRKRAMNCTFDVPVPAAGDLDIDSAEVVITHGNPATTTTPARVNNSGACTGSPTWYYDNNTNPTQILLCQSACDVVRNDLDARMDVIYQCLPPPTEPFVPDKVVLEYDATGACPNGHIARWSDFSWRATTPGDSKIEFEVADSPSGTATDLLFSGSSDVNQNAGVCASAAGTCFTQDTREGGPLVADPGRAVVDYTLDRQGLNRNSSYLRIDVWLHPSSMDEAPTLYDWDLQVTCEAYE